MKRYKQKIYKIETAYLLLIPWNQHSVCPNQTMFPVDWASSSVMNKTSISILDFKYISSN